MDVRGARAAPGNGSGPAERGPATRLRHPSWRDSRLLIGILIVLASVALGARVVAAADRTVPAYAAAQALVPGHLLAGSDLRVVRVHLGGPLAAYLAPGPALPRDATVLRPVQPGELIPLSAVGPASAVSTRPVTVPVDGALPAGLRAGVTVDIWSSSRDPTAGGTAYRPPVRLARAAVIASVTEAGGGLTTVQTSSVQVLLEEAELRAVLEALANSARLALIPAPAVVDAPDG